MVMNGTDMALTEVYFVYYPEKMEYMPNGAQRETVYLIAVAC